MLYGILFIFGLVIGSFLNVVALRYDGNRFVADPNVIGGRSHCPHCGKTLRWFELIPVISFLIQRRRCRNCGAKIGWQYPLVELLSACVFAFVPLQTFSLTGPGEPFIILSTLWVIIFEIFLLIAYIDIRLGIIPDELNVLLGILGIFMLIFLGGYFGLQNHSFFGAYAEVFGLQGNLWLNHILAGIGASLFFALLIAITRGRGMGMGDVKLAFPLGLIFGWPDIAGVLIAAFVVGAVWGVVLIAAKRRTMKGSLPFGPFLVLGATVIFFFGIPLSNAYFHILL